MEHRWIQERLLLLNDPELPESEKQQVQAHLQGCEACQQELAAWQTAQQTMASLVPGNDETFVADVMAGVASETPVAKQTSLAEVMPIPEWTYPVFGLAASVAILFVASTVSLAPISTDMLFEAQLASSTDTNADISGFGVSLWEQV